MLPNLLVVSVENSDDHCLAGACTRLSGERGDGGCPINREIGHRRRRMYLLTPPGLIGFDSVSLKDMEEEDYCLTVSWEALSRMWQIVVYNTRRRNAAYG